MYRSFLSWRYLRHRPTNLIGMVGIFVGVGAMILILSIMTGFLEETRRAVRGSLADLLIEPFITHEDDVPKPGPILNVLAESPEVKGATAQLRYAALITLTGRDSELSGALMQSANYGKLSQVQLIGIDVRTPERLMQPALRVASWIMGGNAPNPPIYDELNTTGFLESVVRVGREHRAEQLGEAEIPARGPSRDPVLNPLMPFYEDSNDPSTGIIVPRPAIVVGAELGKQLGLQRGEIVQLSTAVPSQDAPGEFEVNNLEFVISGFFKSTENDLNLGTVYLPRQKLSEFIGRTSVFSQVLVTLHDYKADGELVRDSLRQDLYTQGLISSPIGGVKTWEEFRGNLLGAIENERLLMGIMLSLVMVVASFTIFAILSMMVTEKRRDIGILCALGATRSGILQTFLWIAFWDALLGALSGAVFGVWAALRIDAIELWLSEKLGYQIFDRDVYLFDHIPTVVMPIAVAVIVLGAFVCALVFAALPAWRAARLDPLEALRYE
ncbi:MAG: lipoprotein-releasing system permease protein [Planctomycetota bacterium]|jgi:lipoprotein-releasing system permease protein